MYIVGTVDILHIDALELVKVTIVNAYLNGFSTSAILSNE